jgi:hypothetical protein
MTNLPRPPDDLCDCPIHGKQLTMSAITMDYRIDPKDHWRMTMCLRCFAEFVSTGVTCQWDFPGRTIDSTELQPLLAWGIIAGDGSIVHARWLPPGQSPPPQQNWKRLHWLDGQRVPDPE